MSDRLTTILDEVQKAGATLIAVSKTHPVARIQALYDRGIRDFGENKVQEMISKVPLLPSDIRWHLIGHLQTNKVRFVAPFVHLIHTVDSLRLLEEIEKQAARVDRVIPVLFQFHIAREASKYGIRPGQWHWLGEQDWTAKFPHIRPSGVMGMASLSDEQDLIRSEFQTLKALFDTLRTGPFAGQEAFREISMGMSSDFHLALSEGSTMVRIGSLIFGDRPA
jgi:PLP dependent protein